MDISKKPSRSFRRNRYFEKVLHILVSIITSGQHDSPFDSRNGSNSDTASAQVPSYPCGSDDKSCACSVLQGHLEIRRLRTTPN